MFGLVVLPLYIYRSKSFHLQVMSRRGVFFNFSCGSKVIHETIAWKRDQDLRSGRSLGTRYAASRYWVARVGICGANAG